MKKLILVAMVSVFGLSACENLDGFQSYDGPNPFLEPTNGKADTGYLNMRGVEVEVTLEADVEAPAWRMGDAAPELAQFAVTYLREENRFYLEILAEDATAPERVEWLVDGEWISSADAQALSADKLRRFRMRGANAVVLNDAVNTVHAGQQFTAKVPIKPYSIMSDADKKCASYNSHIDLSQSIYWYLWDPERNGCPSELLQTMTVTVERVLENNPSAYPEYDQLWADDRLDVVVLFGKLDDDGDIKDDFNWRNADRFCSWLEEAGFKEEAEAEIGRRFLRWAPDGVKYEVVDVYYPDAFHSVADHMRIHNWQKAVREHEVVMYNGHSVLGTGYAFEVADYPESYQIFQVASCLSYEYYVRPVLAGKGGWESVDVLSNVEPTYYHENLPLCGALLAGLFEGFENGGRVSWQDIMEKINRKLGHARFGVSGARGNCFSPNGNLCDDPEPYDTGSRYEQHQRVDIPDNNPNGAVSVIDVPDRIEISKLSVEVNLSHTYVGDLVLTLEHAGVQVYLWNREGGSDDDLVRTFDLSELNGVDAQGEWRLSLFDQAGMDTGRLNHWALVVNKGAVDPDPDPDPVADTYEAEPKLDIPDNDATGVKTAIDVPAGRTVGTIEVELDLSHSYVGDLQIELAHGGKVVGLWNRQGGGSDDIRTSFPSNDFAGQDAGGRWELRVIDHARLDEGRVNRWALKFFD